MLYIVQVDFLSGGTLLPDEFFRRIEARWSCIEEPPDRAGDSRGSLTGEPRRGICIADLDSIQQLSIDISIMPGAGIANIQVLLLETAPNLTMTPG